MKINEPCWAVVNKSDGHVADYFISEAVGLETIRKMGFEVEDYTIIPVTIVPTAELERLRACERVLREVEWSAPRVPRFGTGEYMACPSCGGFHPDTKFKGDDAWAASHPQNQIGHYEGCTLAAALGSEAK